MLTNKFDSINSKEIVEIRQNIDNFQSKVDTRWIEIPSTYRCGKIEHRTRQWRFASHWCFHAGICPDIPAGWQAYKRPSTHVPAQPF
jgi:hypothetical protein